MTLRIITILIFCIGLGLFFYSLTLSYYKDHQTVSDSINFANEHDFDKQEYYKIESELRTNKTTFMDLGAGIAIASASIFLFLLLTNSRKFSDFKRLKTLNKAMVFISANLVWLLLIPGTFWYYTFRGGRGDYSPFADSVGIPVMTQIPYILYMLIPLNIFLLLTTIKTNLPTLLFVKADNYSKPVILWEIFFGLWLLINFLCLVEFVIDGNHFAIPINLFFTLILLTLRAGQISKFKKMIDGIKIPL